MRSHFPSVARLRRWACAGATLPLVAGCALLTPLPTPTRSDERLAMFPTRNLPVRGATRVLWNRYQVPYIVAEFDDDAAFALGLVHAHLRLGQMMAARAIAWGRSAELVGPAGADLDHTLRALGIARAADAIVAGMDPEARRWIERFVEGVNLYQTRMTTLPHEYRVLGVGREPFTPRDIVAIGRLGGIDVTWGRWLELLPLRDSPDWDRTWAQLLRAGERNPASFGAATDAAMRRARERGAPLMELLRAAARTGSNSVAVSGARTRSGAPLVAHDPHLGFVLPNFWLIAGLHSPSYQVVGLMAPGLPVFALGRSPWLAWGGTNLYAATSDLVDVTDLPPSAFEVEEQPLRVRFAPDRVHRHRTTPHGPLLNDAPLFPAPPDRRLALRWTGHETSDEVAALLGTMRARTLEEARTALADYALPALNWVLAETSGRIGHFLAVRLPARPSGAPEDLWISAAAAERSWAGRYDARTLPAAIDPPSGFLASANNRPTGETPTPIGWFFGGPDRVLRMQELLGREHSLELGDLEALQRDVESVSAREIAALLRTRKLLPPSLEAFRGSYPSESKSALLFEAYCVALAEPAFRRVGRPAEFAVLRDGGSLKATLLEILEGLPEADLRAVAEEATRRFRPGDVAGRTWGDRHRFALAHPLRRIPVLGRRYPRLEWPAPGSFETLQKTAHPHTIDSHSTFFGSQSRFVADLGDPDASHFVLLGGQDGWLGSENFDDQVELWRRGEAIAMPLRREALGAAFPKTLELRSGN